MIDVHLIRRRLGEDEWSEPVCIATGRVWIFRSSLNSETVIVVVTELDDVSWIHASISNWHYMPAWGDLKLLHAAVFGDGWAYQVFPAVPDLTKYTLHLFGRLDGKPALPDHRGYELELDIDPAVPFTATWAPPAPRQTPDLAVAGPQSEPAPEARPGPALKEAGGTTSDVDLLVQAASTLRANARAVADHMSPHGGVTWTDATDNWLGGVVGQFCGLMSPEVAMALADWLDWVADMRTEAGIVVDWRPDWSVEVARQILRETIS